MFTVPGGKIRSKIIASMSKIVGGVTTRVLFDDGGTLAEAITLTWNKVIGALTIGGFNTSNKQLNVGSIGIQAFALNNCFLAENAHFNGTSWVYESTGASGLFYFFGPEGQFRFTGSGTGGASLPNTNSQLKVNADGTVALGGQNISSTPGTYTGATIKANPNGTVNFPGYTTAGLLANDTNGLMATAPITVPSLGTWHFGGADVASPQAQTIAAAGVSAGHANTAAPTFTLAGSLSNGSGGGGDFILQTTQSSAGSGVQNTPATALTLKGGTQAVVTAAARGDSGYGYAAPTTGGTVTLGAGVYNQIIDPAGTLATLTINMTPSPFDGQMVAIKVSQVVTALTVSGNGNSIAGNPTSAAVGSSFTGIYRAANTTWYF